MLPAQVVCVAEAAMGPPPSVQQFLSAMKASMAMKPQCDEVLYGASFKEDQCTLIRLLLFIVSSSLFLAWERTARNCVSALLDFERICLQKGAPMESLDDWLVSFGRFVVHVKYLKESEAEQTVLLQQRSDLCKECEPHIEPRCWNQAFFFLKKSLESKKAITQLLCVPR